jgi:hypothetical protein
LFVFKVFPLWPVSIADGRRRPSILSAATKYKFERDFVTAAQEIRKEEDGTDVGAKREREIERERARVKCIFCNVPMCHATDRVEQAD